MPTATSLLVIAKGYGFPETTMSMLCAALMLGKVVSFLFLFVAAAIFTLGDNMPELQRLEAHAVELARTGSFACCLLIVLSATRVRAWRTDPLLRLLVLVVLQLALAGSSMLLERRRASGDLSASASERWLGLISLLRWSTDSWLIVMQVRARRASAALGQA